MPLELNLGELNLNCCGHLDTTELCMELSENGAGSRDGEKADPSDLV